MSLKYQLSTVTDIFRNRIADKEYQPGENSWITVPDTWKQTDFRSVIHRHFDERGNPPWWHLSSFSATIDFRKGVFIMAHKFTEEQLNNADKSLLIQMILNLQDQSEALTKEVHDLNEKMQLMMEQLVLAKKNRFGRSSEKMDVPGQICFMEVDGTIVFFNEAEYACDLDAPEPEDLDLAKRRGRKRTGKGKKISPGWIQTSSPIICRKKNSSKNSGKMDGSSFRMRSHADINLFQPKLRWTNIISVFMPAKQRNISYVPHIPKGFFMGVRFLHPLLLQS